MCLKLSLCDELGGVRLSCVQCGKEREMMMMMEVTIEKCLSEKKKERTRETDVNREREREGRGREIYTTFDVYTRESET